MSEQLVFLKETAGYISPCISVIPKKSCNIHKFEDACIRVMEKEDQIKMLYNKLDEINKIICSVSDPVRQTILIKRYLSNKTWTEISRETGISLRHVQRLHDTTLEELSNNMKIGMECH